MAVNSRHFGGKRAILAEKTAIFAKNSLKPPIFGGKAAEKVKNLALATKFFFSFFFQQRSRGGIKKIRLRGIPLPPLCTRMVVTLHVIGDLREGIMYLIVLPNGHLEIWNGLIHLLCFYCFAFRTSRVSNNLLERIEFETWGSIVLCSCSTIWHDSLHPYST